MRYIEYFLVGLYNCINQIKIRLDDWIMYLIAEWVFNMWFIMKVDMTSLKMDFTMYISMKRNFLSIEESYKEEYAINKR